MPVTTEPTTVVEVVERHLAFLRARADGREKLGMTSSAAWLRRVADELEEAVTAAES